MNVKKLFSILLIGAFVTPLIASDQPLNTTTSRKSIVGEATEAVVGRVFGVEGDASDIKYHVVELTAHSPSNAAVRSAFVPGWGQGFNNERVKGSIFFLGTLGAVFGSFKLYEKAGDAYDDYKASGLKNSNKYDDYEQYRQQSLILGGAAAVLWIVGIFDAYRHAYQPLYSSARTVDVAFNDDGASFRLRKTF